jgi:hypothetical protein
LTNSALGKRSNNTAGVTPSPAPKRDRSGISAVDSLEGAVTPNKSALKAATTPGSAKSMGSASVTVTPQKTATYSSRSGRNTTVVSYNPNNLNELEERAGNEVTVNTHPSCVPPATRHGFAPLVTRAKSLEDRWQRMNDAICQVHKLKSEEEDMIACAEGEETEDRAYWTPVGVPGQRGVVCVGRICNEVC